MSKCCLGLGKWSHFYLYIFGYIISSILYDFLLNIDGKKNGKGLFLFSPILNGHTLIKNLYKYLSFIIFGIIFSIISKQNAKKETKDEKIIKKNFVELIFNEITLIKNQDVIIFFIICLIYVIQPLLISIIRYFGFDELIIWTIDIVFIVLLMNYYFPKNNYFHQNFSIIFVIIVDTILLIVISILKNNDNKNIYTTKNIYICIFIILIYIILSFSLSYAKVNIKYFYEYKNINQYKIITCIGIIGFILIFLFSIILAILGRKEECKKVSLNFYCYDKISYYFRDLKNRLYGKNKTQFFLEIFVITPLYIFFNFISFTCEIFTITYLNPNYLILSENIHYGTLRLFRLYLNPNRKPLKKIIFLELADVFEFLGCIIYLEIIEIKLYGLDKNIKRNISLRGENEVSGNILNNDDDNESEKSFENI